jgi:tetratricopeptide (TPR) repeat protein
LGRGREPDGEDCRLKLYMSDQNLADTQPVQPPRLEQSKPPRQKIKPKRRFAWVWWVLFSAVAFSGMAFLGGMGGYQNAQEQFSLLKATQGAQTLVEQYTLGVQELGTGQYDLARQRFEYVLAHDPGFPGATDKMAEVMQILYATATPTMRPPTPTLTPTRDLRPVQDLLSQAKSDFASGDWDGVVNTLVSLRQVDPKYQVVEVDRLLYLTLRNRGVDKIKKESNLEGGIYDLALAERFGPLDSEAENYRNLARIYMIGSSFWEAYPEQAVYYFRQVASAAPYLRDASGWTATERYRGALMQYGDQLAKSGDWCGAQDQYEQAISIRADASIQATAAYSALQCSPPTETPPPITDTPTFTPTLTATLTPTWLPSETPTTPAVISPTPTNTSAPVVTEVPLPSDTPTPSETPPVATTVPPSQEPLPSDTPTATVTPTTETPVPSDTPTDTVPPPSDTPTTTTQAPAPATAAPTEPPTVSAFDHPTQTEIATQDPGSSGLPGSTSLTPPWMVSEAAIPYELAMPAPARTPNTH